MNPQQLRNILLLHRNQISVSLKIILLQLQNSLHNTDNCSAPLLYRIHDKSRPLQTFPKIRLHLRIPCLLHHADIVIIVPVFPHPAVIERYLPLIILTGNQNIRHHILGVILLNIHYRPWIQRSNQMNIFLYLHRRDLQFSGNHSNLTVHKLLHMLPKQNKQLLVLNALYTKLLFQTFCQTGGKYPHRLQLLQHRQTLIQLRFPVTGIPGQLLCLIQKISLLIETVNQVLRRFPLPQRKASPIQLI